MKQKKINKRVGDVMGGKVLDLPEIRAFHEGERKGLKKGEAERKRLIKRTKELEEKNKILEEKLKNMSQG